MKAEENNSNLRWMLNNGRWVFGLKHRYELFDEMKKASLKGVAEKIKYESLTFNIIMMKCKLESDGVSNPT